MVSPRTTTTTASAAGLDPAALLAIRDLELRARVVVEGLWSGLHRSPFSGVSVEFTEYRPYSPGDDLRYLDWQVLARTDRLYVRKFEDETNLRCHLLVDASRSMSFGSGATGNKAAYARTLAASLAHFLLQQRDMVGLALFAAGLVDHLPARWRTGHLRHLLAVLARETVTGPTQLATALDAAARLWRKRALVVLIADLLEAPETWDAALGRLIAAGHDVRVIQVLDPAELSLDFGRAAEWEDLETGTRFYVDPAQAAARYRTAINAHQADVRRALERRGVPLTVATTDRPLDGVLLEWVRRSAGRRGPARRLRR